MSQRCSFCGEDRRGVDRLIAGDGGVAICGDCARLAVDLAAVPETEPTGDLVLTNIGVLVTNDARFGGYLGLVEGATVAVREGRVTWMGRHRALPDRYRELPEIDCGGRMVAPSFVDAHRHVTHDGDLDRTALTDSLSAQYGRLLEEGATLVEVRSSGAVDPAAGITALAAIGSAAALLPIDVVPTHVIGGGGYTDGHLRNLDRVLMPALPRAARYIDLMLEGIALEDAARLARSAAARGVRSRVHVDREEALELALECGAVSVDGMWGMGQAAEEVAAAEMVMVSVPAAAWVEGRKDPVREMWDAGAVVALGTGCEGGAVATMPLAMAVAVHHGGLEPSQALWSATRGGALAVEDPERGRIRPGARADLVVLDAESPADLVEELGLDPVVRVIKDGNPL